MSEPKCPSCNALIKIPSTGLTMACEFCSHEMPVPDAKARRAKMQKEENRLRQEENKRKKAEAKQKAREAAAEIEEEKENKKRWKDRGKFVVSIPGKIIAMVLPFIGLLIPAYIFYSNGSFDRWIGDAGTEHHLAASQQLVSLGHTPLSSATVVGIGGFGNNPGEQHIQLQQGYCYTFAVGSGEIISQVNLFNPMGKIAASDKTRGYSKYLELCPKKSGLFTFDVHLADDNGRFTYSHYSRLSTPSQRPARPTNAPNKRPKKGRK